MGAASVSALEAAAKAAGLPTYMLHLNRPEVMRYFREQKKFLVEAIAAGNPVALKEVRETSANQVASVNAAHAIELMQQEMDEPNYASRGAPVHVPGITIVIEKTAPPNFVHEDHRLESLTIAYRAARAPADSTLIDAQPEPAPSGVSDRPLRSGPC